MTLLSKLDYSSYLCDCYTDQGLVSDQVIAFDNRFQILGNYSSICSRRYKNLAQAHYCCSFEFLILEISLWVTSI